jgi:hypothetical protein
MAEIQKSGATGENAARFIEFVMMQAQNASLFLGLIPNPQSGKPEVNLEVARMFIDQLSMIQEKTRGNLTAEETNILRNALSNLQMAFFEVTQESASGSIPVQAAAEPEPLPEETPASSPPAETAPQPESRKRFSKSYGS